MNIKRILIGYALLFAAWMIWSSRAGNPPNGYTNAPFDSFCTSCHSPSSSLDGSVSITGIPETVQGGQTYPVTLTVTATTGNAVRAGFQMVSTFADQSNAGDFIPNSSDEGSNTSGGREYIEHRGAKSFTNNVASWSFDWVAPEGPDGASITMYYAGNIANGNNSSSGDRPRSGSMTFNLAGTADPLVVAIAKSDVSCQGLQNGSAQANASGGATPYSFNWSNNESTANISNLPPATYSVTVTDNNGSEATATTTILEPPTLAISGISTVDVLCSGGMSGSAAITLNGGTEPFEVIWSNGSGGMAISDLAAGSYGVTINDANDCSASGIFDIEEPTAIELDMTTTDEKAFMASDGTASVTATGGVGGYIYLWNTGSTEQTLNGLAPGTYMVTVTDANECTAEDLVVVQPFTCGIDAIVTTTNVDCFGNGTGQASISVSGAQEPISYLWSNGDITANIDSLKAGMYDVTVSDANQCQAIFAINIVQPDSLDITFNAIHPLCPGDSTGQVSANISGGTAPYLYQWSSGSIQSMTGGLKTGKHVLTVIDEMGCTAIDSQFLSFQDSMTAMVNLAPFEIYLDSNGHAIIDKDHLEMGITDNCGIDSFWVDSDTLFCSSVDSQQTQIYVLDHAGNLLDTILELIVIDTIAPYFICVEDIDADSGKIVEYETPIPFDNCQVDTFEMIEGLPSGSIFPVGETKVSFMAVDLFGNIGCCSFFVQVDMVTANIDQSFSNKISIFPNPTSEHIWIDFSDNKIIHPEITIYNSSGVEMQPPTKPDLQNPIDMSYLPTGLYFIKIRSDRQVAVKKVAKK
ncbi:MAG: T9SS type A sorting domain-containing protein [Saprospiraceae bacterium]|nr:T9SS type A sorting domain-containing protein [Saprospiraceae bacterium]